METTPSNLDHNKDDKMELVTNGSVDLHGRIADKRTTGGWKASPFIIVNEVTERLAFFAIAVNMVAYLVFEMHQSLPDAATHVTDWIGAAYVLTLLGAFIADAYLGRFPTILLFSAIYALGMILLTLSASLETLRPQKDCSGGACKDQTAFLYGALALIALGTGGIKPCVSSFGADQFDEGDEKEVQMKFSFFNWFFLAINMGAILGITLLVYIQDALGFGWGFGIPAAAAISSVLILLAGLRYYRFKKPTGSPFTRFLQVIVASIRNHLNGVNLPNHHQTPLYEVQTMQSDILGACKLPHTPHYRFLDKAAVIGKEEDKRNRWRICTVTQVEELKSFIGVLPVWASTIALSVSYAQLSTFFLSQARIMDRTLGNRFKIPTGSVPVFSVISIVLVPIYEKFLVPYLRKKTNHHRGMTSLQRMGVGLFVSIFAMASAALVEKKRRHEHYYSDMSVFWLLPQFFLMGVAEVFTYVGQLEFFYDEATDGTRSISSAMFLCEIGIGSWLSTALVKIIEVASGGQNKGWLRNDLNESKLDYFYWILTAISAINFFLYLAVAYSHRGKRALVTDDSILEFTHPNIPNHQLQREIPATVI